MTHNFYLQPELTSESWVTDRAPDDDGKKKKKKKKVSTPKTYFRKEKIWS